MSSVVENEVAPHRGGRSITIMVVDDLLREYPTADGIEVAHDLAARDAMGFGKYGQNLETWDGRDTAMDAYQELLDAAQYLRKILEEKMPNPPSNVAEAYAVTIDSLVLMKGHLNERIE